MKKVLMVIGLLGVLGCATGEKAKNQIPFQTGVIAKGPGQIKNISE